MKLQDLVSALRSTGYPVAYSHFEVDSDNPPPTLPFLTYLAETTTYIADDKVYYKMIDVTIELYTKSKDIQAEESLEDVLDSIGLVYDPVQTWINSEKVFMTTYEVRLI